MPIPDMSFAILVPEILLKSERIHNKIMKECVRQVLDEHHKKTIPEHFQRPARQRYGYAKRVSRYRRRQGQFKTISYDVWKRGKYGTNAFDLVKTGRSRDQIKTQRRISVGGQAKSGYTGKLMMRFAFPGGTGAKWKNAKGGATPDVLVSEVQRTTPEEQAAMAQRLGDLYIQKIKSDTSPRMRLVNNL